MTAGSIGARIGAQLRKLRRASGLSLRELGDRAGIPHQNLLRLERGDHEPHLGSVVRYTRALGVPVTAAVYVLDHAGPTITAASKVELGRRIQRAIDVMGAGAVVERSKAREARMSQLIAWIGAARGRTLAIEHDVFADCEWNGHVCDHLSAYPDDGTIIGVFDQGVQADSLDEVLEELVAAVGEMDLKTNGGSE